MMFQCLKYSQIMLLSQSYKSPMGGSHEEVAAVKGTYVALLQEQTANSPLPTFHLGETFYSLVLHHSKNCPNLSTRLPLPDISQDQVPP